MLNVKASVLFTVIVLSTALPANTGVSLPYLSLYTTPTWYVLKDFTDLPGTGSTLPIVPEFVRVANIPKVLYKVTCISGVINSPFNPKVSTIS